MASHRKDTGNRNGHWLAFSHKEKASGVLHDCWVHIAGGSIGSGDTGKMGTIESATKLERTLFTVARSEARVRKLITFGESEVLRKKLVV